MQNIQNLPLFTGLSAESLAALEQIAQRIVLAEGEKLCEQGTAAKTLYVVTRGGVRLVEHTTEGKDLNLKIYGPGDTFGMLAIAGGYTHHAGVVAVGPTVVLAFAGEEVRRIVQQHPDVGLRVVDALVDHVHHAHDRIRQMAIEKTERRLARALVQFSNKFGQLTSNQQVTTNFTQREIAEFTGTTTETVSRYFKQWEQAGYIKCDRKTVTVLSMNELQRIIDETGENRMGYHLM